MGRRVPGGSLVPPVAAFRACSGVYGPRMIIDHCPACVCVWGACVQRRSVSVQHGQKLWENRDAVSQGLGSVSCPLHACGRASAKWPVCRRLRSVAVSACFSFVQADALAGCGGSIRIKYGQGTRSHGSLRMVKRALYLVRPESRKLDNGAAQVFAIGGRYYIETGVQLTQTCNDGYAGATGMPRGIPCTISGPGLSKTLGSRDRPSGTSLRLMAEE